MDKNSEVLIKKYFEEHSFVASDIESFNNFVDVLLQHKHMTGVTLLIHNGAELNRVSTFYHKSNPLHKIYEISSSGALLLINEIDKKCCNFTKLS